MKFIILTLLVSSNLYASDALDDLIEIAKYNSPKIRCIIEPNKHVLKISEKIKDRHPSEKAVVKVGDWGHEGSVISATYEGFATGYEIQTKEEYEKLLSNESIFGTYLLKEGKVDFEKFQKRQKESPHLMEYWVYLKPTSEGVNLKLNRQLNLFSMTHGSLDIDSDKVFEGIIEFNKVYDLGDVSVLCEARESEYNIKKMKKKERTKLEPPMTAINDSERDLIKTMQEKNTYEKIDKSSTIEQ